MSGARYDFDIPRGKSFSKVLRWGQSRKTYKAISAATQAAPCMLTVTGHDIPDGWVFTIQGVKGMTALNSSTPYKAIVEDANTLELNDVDASGYPAYTTGGHIVYNTPVDLTGYTARMHIREAADSSTTLLELTTENDRIDIDTTNYTITLTMTAATTAAITWEEAVYDLELISSGGTVSLVLYGSVTSTEEVTR